MRREIGREALEQIAVCQINACNFWDDFSSFLHVHPVVDADVQLLHLFVIVQGGTFDDGAGQQDRFQIRYWSHSSRSSDLVVNGQQTGFGFFGFEFEGRCPTGSLGGVTYLGLYFQLVDFDDNAINGEGEFVAMDIPMTDECQDFVQILAGLCILRYRQSQCFGRCQGF